MPETQSAYRRFHSTDTAVTKVYNDLLFAADGGQMSALCLLDLTAAFDTVDHALLIDRLDRQFGLRDNILEWFRSYLCKIRAVRRLWTAVLFLCFSYGAMVWVYLGNR